MAFVCLLSLDDVKPGKHKLEFDAVFEMFLNTLKSGLICSGSDYMQLRGVGQGGVLVCRGCSNT